MTGQQQMDDDRRFYAAILGLPEDAPFAVVNEALCRHYGMYDVDPAQPTFPEWLRRQVWRAGEIGDLARDAVFDSRPKPVTRQGWRTFLAKAGASQWAHKVFEDAWNEYEKERADGIAFAQRRASR